LLADLAATADEERPSLLADLAATADEERPSLLADVVRDYIELTQVITTEEAAHLQKNIGLLQTNRGQLDAILNEARAQEKTPTSEAMIAALEKDIADIDGFILRDHQRLEKLSSPSYEKQNENKCLHTENKNVIKYV
jgi:hypothetical protein